MQIQDKNMNPTEEGDVTQTTRYIRIYIHFIKYSTNT